LPVRRIGPVTAARISYGDAVEEFADVETAYDSVQELLVELPEESSPETGE